MRYIVIFLLLANGAYFIWNWTQADVAVPAQRSASAEELPLLNNGLLLLSEYQQRLAAEAEAALYAPDTCYLAGNFATIDEALGFLALGEDAGLNGAINLSGEALDSQYRLYIPPASSRGIATITLDGLSEALNEAQFDVETYLITRGILANSVALGVYESAAQAEATQQQVLGLGYGAEIQEIPRSTGEIQVLLKHPQSRRIENLEWLELSRERPNLTLTENLCETIAQGLQFP